MKAEEEDARAKFKRIKSKSKMSDSILQFHQRRNDYSGVCY